MSPGRGLVEGALAAQAACVLALLLCLVLSGGVCCSLLMLTVIDSVMLDSAMLDSLRRCVGPWPLQLSDLGLGLGYI